MIFVQLLGLIMFVAFIVWAIAYKYGFEGTSNRSHSIMKFLSNLLDDWFD